MLSQSVSYFVSYSVLLHAKMDFHFEKTLIFIVQISGIQLRLPVFSIILKHATQERKNGFPIRETA